MKVHVLFGQRKERYLGEYPPEALACATEADFDENPAYLRDELTKHQTSGDFESVRIVDLNINGAKLMELLRPPAVSLDAGISTGK